MIHFFDVVDSTNSIALRLAGQGAEHGTVVWAGRQTGGRGRGGRRFCSPAGGIYFSLVLRPRLPLTELPLTTLAVGAGLCRCISRNTEARVQLKWPNDLYLNDRKLAGILTETGPITRGCEPDYIVAGIGININTPLESFPSSLRSRVISLYHQDSENPLDGQRLLESMTADILAAVDRLQVDRSGLLAEWRRLDYLRHRRVEYVGPEGTVPATGVGLAEDGRYIIQDNSGAEHYILAGDINPVRLAV